MPQTPHVERHFLGSAAVRDIVIGMSDGLTVPFALAAGLSGAATSSTVIVTAGLAEIAAGAIAMGLGGYLAARTDAEHYERERAREVQETREKPHVEDQEVREVFRGYGLTEEEIAPVAEAIQRHPDHWVDFMMRFELGLEKPVPGRAIRSALVIGSAYIVGGLIPLAPYMALGTAALALRASVSVTLCALLAFGFLKARLTGSPPFRAAFQTALIGGLAATAAFTIARWVAA
jgi:VIT1/CCC1 family predicted Fe2+/Mn2+ transporter